MTSLDTVSEGDEGSNPIFDALASARARRVVGELRFRSGPVSPEDLAAALARETRDRQSEAGGDEERRILLSLTHSVLPALEDCGLVERTDAGVVATDHPILSDPAVRRLLDSDDDAVDRIFRALSSTRRRHVLSILERRDAGLELRSLGEAVVERERELASADADAPTVDEVCASLHHVHLPALEAAGLIETVGDGDRVTYVGHPALDGRDESAVRTPSGSTAISH